MPKTTHAKTLTLTTLALTTLFSSLTPATAEDTQVAEQAIEQLAQNPGPAVAQETNRLIITLANDNIDKQAVTEAASDLATAVDDATLLKEQVAGDTSTIAIETDSLLTPTEQAATIAQLELGNPGGLLQLGAYVGCGSPWWNHRQRHHLYKQYRLVINWLTDLWN